MKKQFISALLVLLMIVGLFPASALAANEQTTSTGASCYDSYTAIGDSICAGFTQLDYEYTNGFDMMDNINNSPEHCYARLVGKAFDSDVYNLGKCGCDSTELLDILTNTANTYNPVYLECIGNSDLITLEIGSNDLLMKVAEVILECVGGENAGMTHQQAMAMAEPLLTGDFEGLLETIKLISGIEADEEQIAAIQEALTDDALSATLDSAYQIFLENFPKIVSELRSVNQTAELVILNYYNPFKGMTLGWGDSSYNIGDIIQVPTDKMNSFTKDFCAENSLKYVDISDTPTNVIDPHPSNEGHKLIASKIVDALATTVTATAKKGGSISPSGANIAKLGDSLTFQISPECGFIIADVLVDGISIGAQSSYTFDNIISDHSIEAHFIIDDGSSADGVCYYETYTALGDSITAGFSRDDYDSNYSNPSDCYVAIAAKRLGVIENHNLGLLGLKTGDLLEILTSEENVYHDKFAACLKDSELITIDIGSNDLTMELINIVFEALNINLNEMSPQERNEAIRPFMNGASFDSLYAYLKENYGEEVAEEKLDDIAEALNPTNVEAKFTAAYARFTENWDGIISALREINHDADHNAAIVALGYYNIGADMDFEFKGVDYRFDNIAQPFIDSMNAYISSGSNLKDEYLYIDLDSEKIELITLGGAITVDPHPSDVGHAQIAGLITDKLLNAITVINGDGGTVTPNGITKTAYGLTKEYEYSFTFTPDEGRSVAHVKLDGESVEVSGSGYTFKEVSADHKLSVAFSGATEPEDKDDNNFIYYPSYYSVSTSTSAGGHISPSTSGMIIEGSSVSFTITPDDGYEIESVAIDGKQVAPTNEISFRNIAASHNIFVSFKAKNSGSSTAENPFLDIRTTDWYYDFVMKAYSYGILKGTSDTSFDPSASVNLAMLRTLLYQMEAEPSVTNEGSLSFLSGGEWYANSFVWAVKNGLVLPHGNGAEKPEDNVTREEIITTLYLYAKYKSFDITASSELTEYFDTEDISDWAKTAIKWAVAEGIMEGTDLSCLEPRRCITRAEIAALICRFTDKYF